MAPPSSTPILSSSFFNSSSATLVPSSSTSNAPSRPTTRDGDTLYPVASNASSTYGYTAPGTASSSSHGGGAFGFLSSSNTQSSSNSSSATSFFRDRKSSFSRKHSFSSVASRRRGSSNTSAASAAAGSPFVTDAAAPPALPDFALAAAARITPLSSSSNRPAGSPDLFYSGSNASVNTIQPQTSPEAPRFRMMGRTATGMSGYAPPDSAAWQNETNVLHQHVTELANKRMSTLAYLRKAHEGRVYWFNTYLFEKPDMNRMASFDQRKMARKATNHLLLGLSLPTIVDLYSSTPLEFLRALNALLAEFDSFQQLHGDSSTSLARARLPSVFRRPGGKSRRSTSASEASNGGGVAGGGDEFPLPGGGAGLATPSVMTFAAAESDLLPGEEYSYLLTPSLPFEPDFFETFATLCDVLIDTYARFLQLVPGARECTAPVAELFTKADAKVRRLLVQGVVKDFEEHSKSHVRSEMANIGKVVLGGLM